MMPEKEGVIDAKEVVVKELVATAKETAILEFEAWLTKRAGPLALADWEKSIGIARARIALAVLREFKREQEKPTPEQSRCEMRQDT